MMGFYNISKDDTLNQKLEKNLKSFDELLKPIKKNKARIKTWTDVAEDSFAIVDFKKMASKRKL